ncbi:hypothetical protein HMPREF3104_00425 [Corynebacterium sp. HMSC30G07]|uniref:hypothetical protein n=1 Tax=Corynebacterium sp. HMSC30G07 TaxID=1581072 RepID=UPI0008A23884|nr:hypothetical protein [Corynebacterium sp. HMSC30G07]OFT77996.1 hypothetical protein HMPREF3104_00425 [Corynebacterium sp. HMSC30G07]
MKQFLIVYNRRTGDRQLTEYAYGAQAIRARLEAESQNSNPDVEIVVIGAASLDDLKVTHSRYFTTDELPPLTEWARVISTL